MNTTKDTSRMLVVIERMLRDMGTQSRLYMIVKKEMIKRGHWKQLARGEHAKKRT